jgi:transcriptional regulator with XRE-family HTH domain
MFSVLHIYMATGCGTFRLMDSKQIRRIRLKQIIAREKSAGGSQASLARKIGTDPAYLSQILGKEERDVGDDLARRVENAYKLSHGWMDSLGNDGLEVTSEAMEMALIISDLPDNEKEVIRATLEAFRRSKK